MKQRVILYAEEGKILTNGEEYGKQIFLADDENVSDYYEITELEYEEIEERKARERRAEEESKEQ